MKPKPRRLIEHEDLPLFAQYQGVTPLANVLAHCSRCLARLDSANAAHECVTDKPAVQLEFEPGGEDEYEPAPMTPELEHAHKLLTEADELQISLALMRLPIGVRPVTAHQIKAERVYQKALARYLRRERRVFN